MTGKDQYKISVITASYNSARTIEQTIQSVVGQTYGNIEYIIIDGGSTDGTVDIIKKYEDKIAYWVSEPDKGIYDAFNKGVQAATGEYVQFLGSDDCLCDVSSIKNVIQNLSIDVDILSANVWEVEGRWSIQRIINNAHAIDKRRFNGNMIPHPGMFTRRELLLEHPFDISYKIAADYLFFLTCYYDEKVKFSYIELPVVFFSSEGISSNQLRLLTEENNRVRSNFHLTSKEESASETIKNGIKIIFKKCGVFEPIRYFVNRYVRKTWIPHHCKWELCRWCKHDSKL